MLLGQRSPFTHPALLRRGEVMPLLKREDYRERQRKLFRAVTAADVCGTSAGTGTATSLCILGHDTQYSTQNIFYPFHPNNNLLYLCGASEERRCALVLETDRSAPDGFRSILFLPERDSETERWWGPSTGPKRALSFFGVDKSLPSSAVGAYLKGSAAAASASAEVHYDLSPQCNLAKFSLPPGLKRSKRLAVCLANLRMIKSPKEMQMMREGASVAADAFKKTMQCKYDNEAKYAAKMDFETRMSGLVTGPAYQAVVAGSPRSTYIHWVRSDAPLSGKELMLMDAGARHVSGYCSDISRTWPLSGRFEDGGGGGGQLELYQMVLEVQKKCLKELQNSPSLNQLHLFSVREMAKGIIGLGGFSASQVVDLYPHHIGHHLGLDVHDCLDAPLKDSVPLREGMCITVEPGIYVPDSAEYPAKYRGLGVRIEDDVLITGTDGRYEVITSAVPKEISDIESLLA